MKFIKKLVDEIDEELCGAKNYAEKYVELKAADDMAWASKYKAMANDELSHASTLHERAVEEIEALRKIYTPPQDMFDKWEKSHAHYVEKRAWIAQMLTL